MNTLSIRSGMNASTATAPSFRLTETGITQHSSPPVWLPAPAIVRKPAPQRPVASTRIYTIVARPSPVEKVLFAVLAAASLAAIGYGFVCALNLVQNWAVFHANISSMVQ